MKKYIIFTIVILAVAGAGIFFVVQNIEDYNIQKEYNIPTANKDKAILDERVVYIKKEGINNYVVLVENGKEIIVDEDETHHKDRENVLSSREFSDPIISPKGNYLIYAVDAWEYYSNEIYNVIDKKDESSFPYSDFIEFTPDEKFLVSCASSPFSGEYYGKIISIPDFNIIYDVFNDENNYEYMMLDCEINKTEMIVKYKLSCHNSNNRCPDDVFKIIEYNLKTNNTKSE